MYIYVLVEVYVLLSQSGLKTGLSLPPSQAAKQPQVFLFFFVFVQSVVFFVFVWFYLFLLFLMFFVGLSCFATTQAPSPLSPVLGDH